MAHCFVVASAATLWKKEEIMTRCKREKKKEESKKMALDFELCLSRRKESEMKAMQSACPHEKVSAARSLAASAQRLSSETADPQYLLAFGENVDQSYTQARPPVHLQSYRTGSRPSAFSLAPLPLDRYLPGARVAWCSVTVETTGVRPKQNQCFGLRNCQCVDEPAAKQSMPRHLRA